jgi:alpha-methylacyl-CoA racemase
MGPLHGIKIVEMASIGPGPWAGMVLSDLGADLVRVDRATGKAGMASANPDHRATLDVTLRGRPSIAVDLRHPEGAGVVLRLCEQADALIEGYRPGVMERLGLGPDVVLERNPRLVYGRMTGYGQDGPLSKVAGHDMNYIGLSGALRAIARHGEKPLFPLNLVGDYGGGGMLLLVGVLAALLEARTSGRGQVVDAAMVEGSALLSTLMWGLRAMGVWSDEAGVNMLDSGAHFYEIYETADGEYMALGAIEPQFYAEFLRLSGLDQEELPAQFDRERWPELKERFAAVFRTKTRAEWAGIMEAAETCCTPILNWSEAPEHHHNRARGAFVERDGVMQPAPAPRFSRTPAEIRRSPSAAGQDTDAALAEWGFAAEEVGRLRGAGAVG